MIFAHHGLARPVPNEEMNQAIPEEQIQPVTEGENQTVFPKQQSSIVPDALQQNSIDPDQEQVSSLENDLDIQPRHHHGHHHHHHHHGHWGRRRPYYDYGWGYYYY